ncbi:MAG: aminotransferase class V-fold PLP-dependent enzyme [Verrucomicrobiaceae bacterium]|nr:MAG: aminotransferase class V-fold PLP-dependent enzyme [Verrucomicrobiaceae bacterium]
MSSIIYLDNNATTRIAPEVLETMLPWLGAEGYGNPSSAYGLGRAAAAALEVARGQVAGLAECRADEIIFTSCGTESINTAVQSALALDPDKRQVITTAVEHSATIKLCEHLAQRGYEITWLPVDSSGGLDLEQLAAAIRPDTALITLLWANNETGVLFPIHEIAEIAGRKKVLLHVDAVQAFGKLQLSLGDGGIHFLSMSGHKLHAPKGVGALYVNRRTKFTPLLRGSQENARRGGTQNVASIVGFGKAAEFAFGHLGSRQIMEWRDAFEDHILSEVPGTTINGDRVRRLPNVTNISFDGIESEGALLLLDQHGICCSAGSACTSGSINPSHVLKAMGLSNEKARASLRFSFGRFNSAADIQQVCSILPGVVEKLRSLSPAGTPVLAA